MIETFPPGTLRKCDLGHPVARFNGKPRLRSTALPWRRAVKDGVDWLLIGRAVRVVGPMLFPTPVAGDPRFSAQATDDKPVDIDTVLLNTRPILNTFPPLAKTEGGAMPTLRYEGYCRDCAEHIREGDLFGRLHDGNLYCEVCYGYHKPARLI